RWPQVTQSLEMESRTELLSDAAFFQEAADFLDRSCSSPSSTVFSGVEQSEPNATSDMLELLESSVDASSNTSLDERDLAVIALTVRREKEKLRRRKQHQRVKNEFVKLRQANDELSLKLKKLRLAQEARRNPSEQCSIWKEFALLQRQERLRSEAEKRRLTATAQVQATYIENLHGLFQLQQNSATLENTLTSSVIKDAAGHRLESTDMPMLSSLLQKIDSCRVKMDGILNECGLSMMPAGVKSSMHWCDESGELKYHQSLQKLTLPFDLETAQQSCWKSFDFQQHQRDRKEYDGIGDSENTVALKYRVVRTLASGMSVSVVQWLVARRFIEEYRVSYIWKTYTEGEGIFRGMHSNQTGWCCLRPLPDGSGTSGELCIRQFPVLFNASPTSANEFYGFLQSTLDEDKRDSFTVIHDSLPEHYIAVCCTASWTV
ncbi:hypothetical protein F441_10390, partial [Phytophthora nicotianae CJ01A1]